MQKTKANYEPFKGKKGYEINLLVSPFSSHPIDSLLVCTIVRHKSMAYLLQYIAVLNKKSALQSGNQE